LSEDPRFVSSINVYADTLTLGQTTDAVLCEPVLDTKHFDMFTELTVERYGGTKVASENAVRERMGADRAFVVRPGVISGPGDLMDRFGYWAARFARGGRALIPDTPHQPVQHIDVRDLAAWIVTAGEQHLTGTYDAISPVLEPAPHCGRRQNSSAPTTSSWCRSIPIPSPKPGSTPGAARHRCHCGYLPTSTGSSPTTPPPHSRPGWPLAPWQTPSTPPSPTNRPAVWTAPAPRD
jgi:hypothetical protein